MKKLMLLLLVACGEPAGPAMLQTCWTMNDAGKWEYCTETLAPTTVAVYTWQDAGPYDPCPPGCYLESDNDAGWYLCGCNGDGG